MPFDFTGKRVSATRGTTRALLLDMTSKDITAAMLLGTNHGETRWESKGTFSPLRKLPKNSSEWYGLGEDDAPRAWPSDAAVLEIANAFARREFEAYRARMA